MSFRGTRSVRRGLVLVTFLITAVSLSGAVFEVPPDHALVEKSDLVVIATPIDSRVELDSTGSPVTITTMHVDKQIIGESDGVIEVREQGGWIGGRGSIVTGAATFEPGRRVLLFLSESGGSKYRTWGGALGKFDFVDHGHETFLVRGLEDGSLCSLLPDGTIGHDVVRTSAFVDWVREVAVRGTSDIEYESAVDHQALSESRRPDVFPSSSHRGAYLVFVSGPEGSKPGRWQIPSMLYYVNGTQPGIDGVGGSQSAAGAWSTSGSDVSIGLSSPCSICEREATDNSEMAIILAGDPSAVPSGENFVAGVQLILTIPSYTLDGESFYPIDHADIVVSSNFNGSQALFDAIVAHEMGHAIGLRHSNAASPSSSDAIMNSNVGPIGANLQLWDLDAVQTVYGDGPECRVVEITGQSSDKTISYQQSTTVTVSVSSTTTSPSYQWYTSFTNDFGTATEITGATSSSYNTGPLESGTYYFWAKVFNDCSTEVSSPIQITVNPCIPPAIVTEPSDTEISAGSTATLKITADGSSPLSFQWYRGESGNTSSPIIGATSSTYKTAALNATSTYWVAISNDCGNVGSRTVTVTVVGGCDLPTITTHPASQTVMEGTAVTLSVSATSSNGSLSYAWFRVDGETSVAVGSDSPTFVTPPLTAETHYFVNVTDSCGTVVSNVAIIQILGCQVPVIESITPNAFSRWGASETLSVSASGDEPLTYQWYLGEQGDTSSPITGATSSTYQTMPLTEKTFFWVRVTNGCGSTDSTTVVIDPLCLPSDAPSIGVVPPEAQTGLPYVVSWTTQPGVSSYELQESSTPDFASVTTYDVEGQSRQFVKAVVEPTRFYYRVRGIAECDGSIGGYSPSISVAVVPPPLPTSTEFDVVVPVDTTTPISLTVFVPGLDTAIPFTIETTIDWLSVTPSSGVLPTEGMNFTITADATQMQLGSNTGSFTVLFAGSGGKQASDSHSSTTAVTVSLVTPVSTGTKTRPSDDSLILLGVAHAAGFGSQWQSDVRLLNIGTSPGEAALKYVPAGAGGSQNVKATAVELKPGVNTAFNDIVKNVYGVGSTGDSQVGSLEIHPSASGSLATIASSRTFNKSSSGTFGQFIPGIPFFRFIGQGEEGEPKPRLSMQQISQSDKFRTNVAILEASGSPVSVAVSIYDTAGTKIADIPYDLGGGELKTLNSLLATNGISLDDGRIEVTVTGGEGRVHAYSSVVDNLSNDPFLVPAVDLTTTSGSRWVLPGMADFQTGQASWRSDVRIFNAGTATVRPMLTFYPQGGGNPTSFETVIEPGQIRALNNLLRETFGLDSIGGAMHITTSSPAQLVATARTYDLQESGTYGQFIPAVNAESGFGTDSRATYVLQLEESEFFRSNVGITEITGNPVFLRITASVPGLKAAPSIHVNLDGYGFTQFNRILTSFLGTGAAFNGRVTIEVLSGEGRIAAYGSVIDNSTQDPTYVPGQ